MNRISTLGNVIILEHEGVSFNLANPSGTSKALEAQIRAHFGLGTIFVHKNRDGTFALAYGQEPDVWPEDEV